MGLDNILHTTHSLLLHFLFLVPCDCHCALNDLTILFSAPDTGSRVSTLEKDKSSMSSSVAPGARSSMSSVVGLTAGLASAAKQQRSEHHAASNNGRSQANIQILKLCWFSILLYMSRLSLHSPWFQNRLSFHVKSFCFETLVCSLVDLTSSQ